MKIIATHLGHDPNYCVIDISSNNIIHIEEERISKIKHGSTLNENKFLISNKYNTLISDINNIIVYTVNDSRKIEQALFDSNIVPYINHDFNDKKYLIKNGQKHFLVNHHLAHSAYVYYTKPNYMTDCDILSYDGWGLDTDRYFIDKDLKLIDKSVFGLGAIWSKFSIYIFNDFGMEGKIMGLSSFGKISEKLYNHELEYLNSIPYYLNDLDKLHKKIVPNFINEIKKEDIAYTLQKLSEDVVLKYLIKNKTSKNLCISGGIGLNGYINQKILEKKIYENVHISPACSDSGSSIGAALFVVNKINNIKYQLDSYLGNDYEINEKSLIGLNYKKYEYKAIYNIISDEIKNGKIIAWYQGKSESGPRALGNRSILCDPRNKNMKDYLNNNVKHRENFRPFAPAILKEEIVNWFENIKESPYMLKIAKYKKGMGEKVPAVCHIDYTGRVQTVTKENNLHFYNLIKTFFLKTNIPILLNTSLNDNKQPIVETPEDAINIFNKTGIDILVLKNYIIYKGNK